MELSKRMEEALNKQVNYELYSSYLYMAMSANFEVRNLKGFANWMKVQAQEEMTHAMKFYSYIIERGGRPILDVIEKPPTEWNTPLMAFQDANRHEKKVTKMISNLVELATKEKDYATRSMLKWFVDEQVEEEASTDEVVQKLKLSKDAPRALFMLDKELGQRVFVDEANQENNKIQ